MIYKDEGKGSRAWWLQGIKKWGGTSKHNMSLQMHAGQIDVAFAIKDLIEEGHIRLIGADGRGKRPKFELTDLGISYLARNPEPHFGDDNSANDIAADKPPVLYTWKRVLGGGVKYYADGQHIAAALVPEDVLLRIRGELGMGKFGSDVEPEAKAESHGGNEYTWKKPVVGPTQYFCNGEFILETKVPHDEMNRMLEEQGSPLLGTQETHSYRVKVLDNGRRVYFKGKQIIRESEIPAEHQQWMKTWMPPKEGDPRLKATRRPKNPDDMLDDDLGDEPTFAERHPEIYSKDAEPKVLDSIPLASTADLSDKSATKALLDARKQLKGRQVRDTDVPELPVSFRPLPNPNDTPMPADFLETPAQRTAKGIAIAQFVADNGGVPVDDTRKHCKTVGCPCDGKDWMGHDPLPNPELALYPWCIDCNAPTQESCLEATPSHVRTVSRAVAETITRPAADPVKANEPLDKETQETPRINSLTPVADEPETSQIQISANKKPEKIMEFADALRYAIGELLIEKHGDDVTVKDLLEFVESRDE